jgi:hypothetical protein
MGQAWQPRKVGLEMDSEMPRKASALQRKGYCDPRGGGLPAAQMLSPVSQDLGRGICHVLVGQNQSCLPWQ